MAIQHSAVRHRADVRRRPCGLTVRAVVAVLAAVMAVCCGQTLGPVPVAAAARSATTVGVWPLQPRPPVARGLDLPTDPWGAGHRGVDLVGRPGQPVRAALAGTVTWSGVLAGRGVVVVDHGTTRTTYQPVEDRAPVGATVGAGARIGRLGTIGSHCAPRWCLHWGWLRGEVYLDPLQLVGLGPVRLLPLWRSSPVAPARVAVGPRRTAALTTGVGMGMGMGAAAATATGPVPSCSWRPAPTLPAVPTQARGCAW